ncbi:PCP reductase family protein [Nitrospira sp. CMX1]|nr:PCP reductase family protein [Nitrospira sp.]MBX3328094.1 PCP reductase family protein [Nitrospira sp.]
MLTCGCGRWMHTEGIEERAYDDGVLQWFIRSECRGCGLKVGIDVPGGQPNQLVDRLLWTDEALHRLDRMPPYLAALTRDEVEQEARSQNTRVVTYDMLLQPRGGNRVEWDPEAERRLDRVPAPVRAMARIELERTAADRGLFRITVALMEEVKAKYFGMGAQKT